MAPDHGPTARHPWQAGGCIRRERVCGDLDMARTLGDFEYKGNKGLAPAEQIVSPYPDLRTLAVGGEDVLLVGGWVRGWVGGGGMLAAAVEALLVACWPRAGLQPS
jgi:hypothetical protein